MEKHANKTRTAAIVMAVALLALSISIPAVHEYGEAYNFRLRFTAAQQIKLARAIGFELAPGETLAINYAYHIYSQDSMTVYVEGLASEEDFLSRLAPETALEEKYAAGTYIGSGHGFILYGSNGFTMEITQWKGNYGATFRVQGPAGKPALAVAKRCMCLGWPVLIFALPIVRTLARLSELVLVAALVVLAVLRRRQEDKQARADKARKRIRVSVGIIPPVMAVLTLVFLISLVDGGYMGFDIHCRPWQEKLLAKAIGFELAPGEKWGHSFYERNAFDKDEVHVTVREIASKEDFLSRLAPKTLPKEKYPEMSEEFYKNEGIIRYCLYGSEDSTLEFHGRSYTDAWFYIKGNAGRPALAAALIILCCNSPWAIFFITLPIILLLGLLSELALIIALIVQRRKAKKEKK
ncbi:MAG: hypothetical protein FWE98_06620 [Oscillospiraceae bacterium]|nr:hypothetical protein [Oscillospiraceae bacterium]